LILHFRVIAYRFAKSIGIDFGKHPPMREPTGVRDVEVRGVPDNGFFNTD
jgi:hypothetical protein